MANTSITNTSQLANSGVTAGTYGSANQIASISVNASGVVTSASNITPAGALSGITSINGGQLGGFRNALINGDMQIWQRGTTRTPASLGASTYTADRWHAIRGANNYTVSRQTSGLSSFQYSIRQQRNSGTTDTNAMSLSQSVTSANSYRFQGKNITISFWARCGANYSATGSVLDVTLQTGIGIDQQSNNGGGFSGVVNVINSSVTLTTSWQRFVLTTSSAVGNSISQIAPAFYFTPTGTAGANDWYELTGVQVEEGNSASEFEFVDFNTQLTRCEFYYEKSARYTVVPAQANSDNGYFTSAHVGGSTLCYYWIPFKISKRISPTITLFNRDTATALVRNYSLLANYTTTALDTSYQNFFTISATSSSGTTTGHEVGIGWSADAEIY